MFLLLKKLLFFVIEWVFNSNYIISNCCCSQTWIIKNACIKYFNYVIFIIKLIISFWSAYQIFKLNRIKWNSLMWRTLILRILKSVPCNCNLPFLCWCFHVTVLAETFHKGNTRTIKCFVKTNVRAWTYVIDYTADELHRSVN